MDKENLILKLSDQLDVLKIHIDTLKKSGFVHELDIETIRKNTTEFYDLLFKLGKTIDDKPTVNEEKISEPPITETVTEDVDFVNNVEENINYEEPEISADENEIVKESEIKEKIEVQEPIAKQETTEPEPIPEEASNTSVPEETEDIMDEEPLNEIPQVSSEDESDTSNQTAYDLFTENSENPIAEKFQADDQSIAHKMQKTTFSNIREAIGINEKFLFINELFNGDLGRYNKILDDINELSTKQGIDTYLFEMKIQFQWADDNEAYVKLKELLDRKFS